MSRYHDVCDKTHNFDYMPDSTVDFKDTLNDGALYNDEIELRKGSVNITINSVDAHRLYDDSQHKKISLSTEVNQIVKNHLDWHAFAPDAKMVYVPKPWISKVMNELTEEQISGIARDVASGFKDSCLILLCEFTTSSFLDFVRTWSRIDKIPTRLFQDPAGDLRLLLKHDMGYKYSLFVKEVFRSVISDIFHLKMESTVTENMIAIRILR
ncbi:MAG TPA: hypothetical protein VE130_14800 [Nitrososphaeraceae archaeon]|jgi:hypothetical protein|nr:hypothetical protein [Nitrososphaeraceae archaeon]